MKKVLGSIERVSFPEFELKGVIAKIDTGAYTGAMHCTKVHEEVEESERILYFSPFDHPEKVIKTTKFEIGIVRSSNGAEEQRYFVDTNIKIQGKTYPITLSLADRSEMRWPVLLGRRFLLNNGFLVDVTVRNK